MGVGEKEKKMLHPRAVFNLVLDSHTSLTSRYNSQTLHVSIPVFPNSSFAVFLTSQTAPPPV